MPGTIAEHCAHRDAANLHAQGFRTVGIGQAGGDLGQFDRAVFQPFVELIRVVVALAVGAVQVRHLGTCADQVVDPGVDRDVGITQVRRRPTVDRQVDVIATGTCLVRVVNIDAVVAIAGRDERAAELAGVRTPCTAGHVFTPDVDQDAVIAVATEGIGLACFQVDQARSLRSGTGCYVCG